MAEKAQNTAAEGNKHQETEPADRPDQSDPSHSGTQEEILEDEHVKNPSVMLKNVPVNVYFILINQTDILVIGLMLSVSL